MELVVIGCCDVSMAVRLLASHWLMLVLSEGSVPFADSVVGGGGG